MKITNLYYTFLNNYFYEIDPTTGLTIGNKALTKFQIDIYKKMSNIKIYII